MRRIPRLLGPLLKTGLSLIRSLLKLLAKSVLFPSGLTAAGSATDAAIRNKIFRPGTAALITLNEEMKNIMKILKSLEESGLLIKRVSETIQN